MVVRSARTAAMYNVMIKKCRDAVAPGSSGLSFFSETEKVIEWVESQNWSINTKKAAFIAFKSVLRDSQDPSLAVAEQKYSDRMLFYRDQHNEAAVQQLLSPREKDLFVTWPKIIAAREKFLKGCETFFDFQDYIIYALYTYQPPLRLDFSPMRVVATSQEAADISGNCLVADASGYYFLLREYKTAVKYGELKLDTPPALQAVLEKWLDLNPSGWLLGAQGGEPMTETHLGQQIRNIMKKAVGKSLGINMLRHSYITYQRRGEPTLLEQQEMARRMGHSIGMSQIYRRLL